MERILSVIMIFMSLFILTAAFYSQPRSINSVNKQDLSSLFSPVTPKLSLAPLQSLTTKLSASRSSVDIPLRVVSGAPIHTIQHNLKYMVKVLLLASVQRKVVIAAHIGVIAIIIRAVSSHGFQLKNRRMISMLSEQVIGIDNRLVTDSVGKLSIPDTKAIAASIKDMLSSALSRLSHISTLMRTQMSALKSSGIKGIHNIMSRGKGPKGPGPVDRLQLSLRSKSPKSVNQDGSPRDVIGGTEDVSLLEKKEKEGADLLRRQQNARKDQQDRLDAIRRTKKEEEIKLADMNRLLEEDVRSLAAAKMAEFNEIEASNGENSLRSIAAADTTTQMITNCPVEVDKKVKNDVKILSLAFTEEPSDFSKISRALSEKKQQQVEVMEREDAKVRVAETDAKARIFLELKKAENSMRVLEEERVKEEARVKAEAIEKNKIATYEALKLKQQQDAATAVRTALEEKVRAVSEQKIAEEEQKKKTAAALLANQAEEERLKSLASRLKAAELEKTQKTAQALIDKQKERALAFAASEKAAENKEKHRIVDERRSREATASRIAA